MSLQRSQKGKCSTRASWADLPHDLLRQIATAVWHSTWAQQMQHMQLSWREPQWSFQQRMWATTSIARYMEYLAMTCRNWEIAMETHPFWHQACAILDPAYIDPAYLLCQQALQVGGARASTLHSSQLSRTCSMYYRLVRSCCLPCRFASPTSSHGVGLGKDLVATRQFGQIPVCPKHYPDKFCGICLKDAPTTCLYWNGSQLYRDMNGCTVTQVDRDRHFEDVVATCGLCRKAAVLAVLRQRNMPRKGEIVANVVDQFAQSGDSEVKEVVHDIEERLWLANHTNYDELHQSAIAAERMRLKQEMRLSREKEALERELARQQRSPSMSSQSSDDAIWAHEDVESEDGDPALRETSSERLQKLLDSSAPVSPRLIQLEIERQEQEKAEEEVDDDDLLDDEFGEFLSYSEEANVRDMALSGWTRSRIMDGCWITPFDLMNTHQIYFIESQHLQRIPPASHPVDSYLSSNHNQSHSRPSTQPPAQTTYHPTMPTLRAPPPPSRLFNRAQALFEHSMRQILMPPLNNLVRRYYEQCNYDGKDVCRVLVDVSSEHILRELGTMQVWGAEYSWDQSQTSPAVTTSTTIGSDSDRNSPASTVKTTPSPPPSADKIMEEASPRPRARSFTPHVPTRFVQHVPHVPRTMDFVGTQFLALLRALWREACSPLFRCRCGPCERNRELERAQKMPRQAQVVIEADQKLQQRQQQLQQQQVVVPSMPKQQIPTLQVSSSEIDVDADDEVVAEEEDDDVVSASDESSSLGPATPPDLPLRRRSREVSDGGDGDDVAADRREKKRVRMTPPPKPAVVAIDHAYAQTLGSVGRRRSREEEDDDEAHHPSTDVNEVGRKKIRVTPAQLPLPRLSTTG